MIIAVYTLLIAINIYPTYLVLSNSSVKNQAPIFLFVVSNLSLTFWIISNFFVWQSANQLMWAKLTIIGSVIYLVTNLLFLTQYPRPLFPILSLGTLLISVMPCILVVLAPTDAIIQAIEANGTQHYGPGYTWVSMYILLYSLSAFISIGFRYYNKENRAENPEIRAQLLVLFWGLFSGIGFSYLTAVILPMNGHFGALAVAPLGSMLYAFSVLYVLLKHNYISVSAKIGSRSAWIAANIFYLFIFIIFIWISRQILDIQSSQYYGFASALLIVLSGTTMERLQSKIRTGIRHAFMGSTYNLTESITDITEKLHLVRDRMGIWMVLGQELDSILKSTMVTLMVKEGALQNEKSPFQLIRIGTTEEGSPVNIDIEPSSPWIDWFKTTKPPILTRTFSDTTQLELPPWVDSKGILFPLYSTQLEGIIVVHEKDAGGIYYKSDIEFLSAIQNIVVTAFELVDKALIAAETITAQRFQNKLIPPKKDYPIVDMDYSFRPFSAVGGDLLHIEEYPELNKMRVIMGDVTGHGMEAALGTFVAESLIVGFHAVDPTQPLNLLVNFINEGFVRFKAHNSIDMGMTIVAFDIFKDGVVNYSGYHDDVLIYQKSTQKCIHHPIDAGLPLGFMSNPEKFVTESLFLETGDIMFICTDGVTEGIRTTNASTVDGGSENQFGLGHIESIIIQNSDAPVAEICNQVKESHENWTMGKRWDDITFLMLRLQSNG